MDIKFSKEDLEDIEFNMKNLGMTPDETVHVAMALQRRYWSTTTDRIVSKEEYNSDEKFRENIRAYLALDLVREIVGSDIYWMDEEETEDGELIVTMGIDILKERENELPTVD